MNDHQHPSLVQPDPRGCLVFIEAAAVGLGVGYLLWDMVHHAVAITAGIGTTGFYIFLFTLRGVATVMTLLTSVIWAVIAGKVTLDEIHGDWVWVGFASVVAFGISWLFHDGFTSAFKKGMKERS